VACVALLVATSACDNAVTPSPTAAGGTGELTAADFSALAQTARSEVLPGSVDDVFFEMAARHEGFAGAYLGPEGDIVLLSTRPDEARASARAIAGDMLGLMTFDDRTARGHRERAVTVEPAAFDFAELAAFRLAVEQTLTESFSIVYTDVDERANRVALGVDEAAGVPLGAVSAALVALGVPPDAFTVDTIPAIEFASGGPEAALPSAGVAGRASTLLTDFVRPIAGGVQIKTPDSGPNGCTLGVPVWHGSPGSQELGFLTASHCTVIVGYNNGAQFGQPVGSTLISAEHEDPPLTNCGSGYSTNCELADVALVDFTAQTHVLPGEVHLTNASSGSGPGGKTVTGQSVKLFPSSTLVGQSMNKVGRTTGWTTGEVTGTCANISIPAIQPDVVQRSTRLRCYTRTNVPVQVGDSGAALFSINYDPGPETGGFHGILSACAGCSETTIGFTSYYVSWAAVDNALTTNVSFNSQPVVN
jgi:hypothetical protein